MPAETITNQDEARKDILIVEPDDGETQPDDTQPIRQRYIPPAPQQQPQQQPQQTTPPHLKPRKIVIHNPVYSPQNLIQVVKNNRFIINALVMTNKNGIALWTTYYVSLLGNQQSPRFASAKHQLKYEITRGSAWFYIDNHGHAVDGVNRWVRVEPGQFHHILNRSTTEPLQYHFEFPGRLDMKRILEEEDIEVE